jgi:hypothetical protein
MPVPFFTAAITPSGRAISAALARRELEGVGQALPDQLDHGLARAERGAEIPADGLADEGEVLLDVGPIETEVAPCLGVVLLGRGHGQDEVQGDAGGPGQDEDDDRQDRQGHQRL